MTSADLYLRLSDARLEEALEGREAKRALLERGAEIAGFDASPVMVALAR